MQTTRILFLCTGNSCRSQMAEGWARALKPGVLVAHSAGTAPHGIDPRAVQVMAEAGIDISGHQSKHIRDIDLSAVDWVVTVCGHADEHCPVLPAAVKRVHVGFDDPPRLAREASSPEQALGHYRRVRDQIRTYIESLPGALLAPEDLSHA